jgi:hypothetical protein
MGMSVAKVPVSLKMAPTGCGGIPARVRPPILACSLWKVAVQVSMKWSLTGIAIRACCLLVLALVVRYGARRVLTRLVKRWNSYCWGGQTHE